MQYAVVQLLPFGVVVKLTCGRLQAREGNTHSDKIHSNQLTAVLSWASFWFIWTCAVVNNKQDSCTHASPFPHITWRESRLDLALFWHLKALKAGSQTRVPESTHAASCFTHTNTHTEGFRILSSSTRACLLSALFKYLDSIWSSGCLGQFSLSLSPVLLPGFPPPPVSAVDITISSSFHSYFPTHLRGK